MDSQLLIDVGEAGFISIYGGETPYLVVESIRLLGREMARSIMAIILQIGSGSEER